MHVSVLCLSLCGWCSKSHLLSVSLQLCLKPLKQKMKESVRLYLKARTPCLLMSTGTPSTCTRPLMTLCTCTPLFFIMLNLVSFSSLSLSASDDNWTPLDLAVMLNERIALLLLAYGAKDSAKCKNDCCHLCLHPTQPTTNNNIFISIIIHVFVLDFKDPEYRRDHLKDLLKKAETERRSVADMIQASGGGSKVGRINKLKIF